MLLALCILVLAIVLAISLSRNQHLKKKFIIWGTAIIVFIAPSLAWTLGILFGMNEGDGFIGMTIMIYGFVFLEVVGFIILYFGIFKRENINRY
ncbi:hypothetical protein [Lysinibacillus antri]|uniref:Uncharacterized protein n=1 Tax=Lysinibacillus antri TaxID=2498145 RepID=A0A432L9V2_9BACI|nr:hypothetical protein [Lysinibacillus antri]RUL50807.1 hypothetical protein EK386_13755 [Lysinibacillus antri]